MPYPAKKNPKLIEEVLSRIAQGETLAALGRELGFHPQSWLVWVRADEALALAYAQARDVGHDVLADGLVEIADDVPTTSEDIQKAKLRIETRLKLLACWNPRKYGTKQTTEIANKEGETLKVEGNADTVAVATAIARAMRAAKRDGE